MPFFVDFSTTWIQMTTDPKLLRNPQAPKRNCHSLGFNFNVDESHRHFPPPRPKTDRDDPLSMRIRGFPTQRMTVNDGHISDFVFVFHRQRLNGIGRSVAKESPTFRITHFRRLAPTLSRRVGSLWARFLFRLESVAFRTCILNHDMERPLNE